jgi:hypothetical protein
MAMRKHSWLIIALFFLILVQTGIFSAASANVAGSSINEWIMFRHDLSHSGDTTGDSANSVKQLWNYSTNAAVWSSPAVANGVVVVGCKDCNIYCLNASSGERIWKTSTGNEVNSSPAIDNDRAYVGCDDGLIYCVEIATGIPVWTSKLGGQVRSCPLVEENRVYVGSGDHDFFCLNASNGNTIWTFPTQKRVVSSPALSDGLVYFACDDYFVYALNMSTGREIWHHHTGSNINSPCVCNGCIYIGSYDGYVCCLNASTGADIWKYQTQDTVTSSAAVAYGCVYIGSEDNNVYCFNATTGKKLWQTPTGFWVWSSPAVANGNVYVGSEDYNLYCLNASNGEVKWTYSTRSYVDSSPTIVNNTLYVGSHDYHLYALTLYNSTTVSSLATPPSSQTFGTFIFDGIACVVGAVVVFVIARSVYLTRRNKKERMSVETFNKKQLWLSAHVNALCALTILVFAAAFLVYIGNGPLWSADEQTYSQMAYHMVKSGDYLLPWSFGEPAIWAGKPPLLMWLMSLAYQVFGINNFASRIWSVLFGVLSLVFVFYLGKKLYNSHVGFLSVIVLGTFTTFYAFATHAMTDGPLVFFILASVYFLLLSEDTKRPNWYATLSGLFFGLALLTKQIEALLIPLIIVVYFLVTKRNLRFLLSKRFAVFWAVPLLIFIPWVLYMNMRFVKDFWGCYFVYGVFTRAITPLEGHVGGYLFYFNYLATSENPLWTILLPFATGLCAYNSAVRRIKGDTLLLVWMAIVLVVFTLAQTKLYWYILPALPAFAIAISNLIFQLAQLVKLKLNT